MGSDSVSSWSIFTNLIYRTKYHAEVICCKQKKEKVGALYLKMLSLRHVLIHSVNADNFDRLELKKSINRKM